MVPEGLLTFLGFFYAMQSLVAVNSLGLFAGLFNDAMGYCLPIISCELTGIK